MALRKRSSSHVRSAIVIPWVEILQDDVLVWNKPLWVSCRVFVIAASIAIDSCRVIVHILVEVQRFVILIRRLRKNSSGLRHYNWWQIGSNTQVITRYFDKLQPSDHAPCKVFANCSFKVEVFKFFLPSRTQPARAVFRLYVHFCSYFWFLLISLMLSTWEC